jgi:hypothetical protein
MSHWSIDGRWLGATAWPQACALAASGDELWCGGDRAGRLDAESASLPLTRLRLDNHWLRLR